MESKCNNANKAAEDLATLLEQKSAEDARKLNDNYWLKSENSYCLDGKDLITLLFEDDIVTCE